MRGIDSLQGGEDVKHVGWCGGGAANCRLSMPINNLCLYLGILYHLL